MDTLAFLKAIWSPTGFYCLALSAGKGYRHRVFSTIEAAAAEALRLRSAHNVFFAIHTLKEEKVWSARKSKWQTRIKANMRGGKAFFYDLDIGPGGKKYATQMEALVDLKRVLAATGLPPPLIVSSGGGLHIYWLLTEELPASVWVDLARRLYALVLHHGLRVDPSRTTDISSVLRVVGTNNLKNGGCRPVQVLRSSQPLPPDGLAALVTAALDRDGIASPQQPKPHPAPTAADDLGSNIETVFHEPPISIKALVGSCAQIRRIAELRGNVPEPEWHRFLGVVRFVKDGRKVAQELSKGHPDYDAAVTDAKLDEAEAAGIGPTSCVEIAARMGAGGCKACPLREQAMQGSVKNPLLVTRYLAKISAAPAMPAMVQTPSTQTSAGNSNPSKPPLPVGYGYTKSGGVYFKSISNKGIETPIVILQHDLYPILRQVDLENKADQHLWCTTLPNEASKTFILSSGTIQEPTKLGVELSQHGIYVMPGHNQQVQKYMSAYIQDLQRSAAAETQHTHLGWVADRTKFVLPDKMLNPTGRDTPVSLSRDAEEYALGVMRIGKKGTLQRQVELMEFYNKPEYLANQFYILASLAAPVFFGTNYAGIIINATGEAGASKSTTLSTACSFWGHPSHYPLNGTNTGATAKSRNRSLMVLSNLPVGLDEITHIADDAAKDFAMNISQFSGGLGLKQDGTVRTTVKSDKSTIMLTTANSSLHTLLSIDNPAGTAGSMRVLEIFFKKCPDDPLSKADADDFFHELLRNFGHIGEEFLRYVVPNVDAVVDLIRAKMRALDIMVKASPSERFWTGAGAAIIVVCELGKHLGLLPFDPVAVTNWFVNVQMPAMRGIVKEEYPSPVSVLVSYLDRINGETVVFRRYENSKALTPVRVPNYAVKGRYEIDSQMMWISKDQFKEFCTRKRYPYGQFIDELVTARVILKTTDRKILGAGTEVEKARGYSLLIDMSHAEMSDAAEALDKMVPARDNVIPLRPAPVAPPPPPAAVTSVEAPFLDNLKNFEETT